MPFQWKILLAIVVAVLRILSKLPAGIDHRPITEELANLVDNGKSDDVGEVH